MTANALVPCITRWSTAMVLSTSMCDKQVLILTIRNDFICQRFQMIFALRNYRKWKYIYSLLYMFPTNNYAYLYKIQLQMIDLWIWRPIDDRQKQFWSIDRSLSRIVILLIPISDKKSCVKQNYYFSRCNVQSIKIFALLPENIMQTCVDISSLSYHLYGAVIYYSHIDVGWFWPRKELTHRELKKNYRYI